MTVHLSFATRHLGETYLYTKLHNPYRTHAYTITIDLPVEISSEPKLFVEFNKFIFLVEMPDLAAKVAEMSLGKKAQCSVCVKCFISLATGFL